MTIFGVFPWVEIGATESAAGVTPNPATTLTFSLTIISRAKRLVLSATCRHP